MIDRPLNSGARLVRFGNVVRLSSARVADPAAAGIERYVGLEHIEPETLHVRTWGLVSNGTTFTTRFRPGQVLFGKRRAYQRKVAVAGFEGVCSGDIYVLEPSNDELLRELLPFVCQSDAFFEHAVGTSAGSLSPRTKWESLADFEFVLPPVPAQRRIAEILRSAVDVEDQLRRLERSLHALYAAERESIFTRSDTTAIEVGSLLEDIVPGRSLQAINEPPRGAREKGVLKVSAVGAGAFLPQESKTLLDQSGFEEKFQVRDNDLLMTRANTSELVGMCCVVEGDHPNLMLSDKTLRLIPRCGIDASFLMEALWSRDVRRQIRSGATGTGGAMKNISQDKIRRLSVRFPAGSEKGIAAERLRQLRAACGATSLRRAAAATTRRQLVNALIGEIVL